MEGDLLRHQGHLEEDVSPLTRNARRLSLTKLDEALPGPCSYNSCAFRQWSKIPLCQPGHQGPFRFDAASNRLSVPLSSLGRLLGHSEAPIPRRPARSHWPQQPSRAPRTPFRSNLATDFPQVGEVKS